jgi:hypothetical protein
MSLAVDLATIRLVARAIADCGVSAAAVADVAAHLEAAGRAPTTIAEVASAAGWTKTTTSHAIDALEALGHELNDKSRRMAKLLGSLPGTTTALARSSGYDPRRVRQVMTALEERGEVERARGPTAAPVWRYVGARASPSAR